MMDLKKQKKIAKEKLKDIEKKIKLKKNIKITKKQIKFYHFNQNNSGGSFTENENVCKNVFIEAHSADEANLLADNFGIYFDGCDQNIDCSCCGDRWYEVREDSGTKDLVIYDSNQEKVVNVKKAFKDTFSDKCIIHYLNGTKETVIFKTEKDCPGHKYEQRYNIGRKCMICGKWEKKQNEK